MASSLPLLHTAMPTPCLNTFWHIDPYIFFSEMFFCLSQLEILCALNALNASNKIALSHTARNARYYGYLSYFVDRKKGATFWIILHSYMCVLVCTSQIHMNEIMHVHSHTHTHTHRVITCGYNLPKQQCTTNQYIRSHQGVPFILRPGFQ